MKQYEELKTTKYLLESVEQRLKEQKKHKREESRKAFMQISLAFLMMGLVAYTMPIWIPALIQFLDWAA